MPRFWRWFGVVVLGVPVAAFPIWGLVDNAKLFCTTALNGLTLAALYFLVASGFTLVFGLMRNVNLAHGSLYLLGAYVGYMVGDKTGSWLLAVAAGFASAALFGLVLQVTVFRFMQGQDLRQTLVTIALSIMLADVLLWIFGGEIYQFDPPRWIFGRTPLPLVQVYPTYRLVVLAISAAIGAQRSPRPCFTVKFTISAGAFSAANTRSPSFSRAASSTTTFILPAAIRGTASGTVR